MKVVILCGGFGTRLKEQTEFIPKPMVAVGGKPLIWHILKIYYEQGFNEFILPLGYKGEIIKDFFVNYKWKSSDFTLEVDQDNKIQFHDEMKCEKWKIHFVDTGVNCLTSRRVFLIKHLIKNDEQFMLTYGDGISDIILKELVKFHSSKNTLGTITGTRPRQKFGLVEQENGIIRKFKEKPEMKDLVNCGFMIFEKEALGYFNGENTMLEYDVLPRMSKDNKLSIYEHKGFWHCIDTQRDYEEANRLWENNPKWKIWKD
jgi:glucose-1-phosphate cytidylyltransferase